MRLRSSVGDTSGSVDPLLSVDCSLLTALLVAVLVAALAPVCTGGASYGLRAGTPTLAASAAAWAAAWALAFTLSEGGVPPIMPTRRLDVSAGSRYRLLSGLSLPTLEEEAGERLTAGR